MRCAAARGDIPIDRADVVARLIFAHLRELDAPPVKGGVIVAGEPGADQPRTGDLQLANSASQRDLELRRLAAEESHGTATAPRICSMIRSAVICSAAAS